MIAKYCKRRHPLALRWHAGQSQSWKAMCDIKLEIEQSMVWIPGQGEYILLVR